MPNKEYDVLVNRRIIDNVSVALLLFDHQLRLIFINPAGEMLLAASSRQVLGAHCHELFGRESSLHIALSKALQQGHTFTEREVELTLPELRTVTVDCTITPLLEPQQHNTLLVELQQIDRQLRIHREEQLIAQHQAAHTLLRGLAHEINNPLGGLRGAAQLLEKELNDVELKEYTDVIIGEADRLQKLLAKLLGPNTRPQKRYTNIHKILEHVRTLVSAEGCSSIHIIRDYDPSLPELLIDPDQLIQAVLNIVRNAVQALDGAGEIIFRTRPQRQMTIGTKRHRLVLVIDIIDNGPGIAPEMAETIFYPMVTGRAEGTGLGLSIAQAMINQHHGLIECSSRPGRTKFTLLIPLERAHD